MSNANINTGIDEFDLINRYFAMPAKSMINNITTTPSLMARLGIGDDAAVLPFNDEYDMVITTDTLLESVHFFPEHPPSLLGYRALAVNLSDLAAMGAKPCWYLLALTLPTQRAQDDAWMKAFSHGLHELAYKHSMQLIGGNTTRGTLSITITAIGMVDKKQGARLRSDAIVGDDLWVTGIVGLASVGLSMLRHHREISNDNSNYSNNPAINQYLAPSTRVHFSQALQTLKGVHGMIDISDGLYQDAHHIAKASHVSLAINIHDLPPQPECIKPLGLNRHAWWQQQLTGGDDYELLFTAAPQLSETLQQCAKEHNTPLFRIGTVLEKNNDGQLGMLIDKDGQALSAEETSLIVGQKMGYRHF